MGNKTTTTTTTTTTPTTTTPTTTPTTRRLTPKPTPVRVVAPAPAPMAPIKNLGLTDLDEMYGDKPSKPLPKISNQIFDVDDDDYVPGSATQNIPSVPPPPYTPEPTNNNVTYNNNNNNNNNNVNKNKRNNDDDDDGEIEYTGMKILPPSEKPVFKPINVEDNEAPEEISRDWEDVDLIDPVTMERMSDPVRGDNCKHKAVFDRKIFEEFKKQNPAATCPICKAQINRLLPNALFKDILQNVKADKIRIYPDNRYEAVN